jgi:hypothetical protein
MTFDILILENIWRSLVLPVACFIVIPEKSTTNTVQDIAMTDSNKTK